MANMAAFHSAKRGTAVHHNNKGCTEAKTIAKGNRATGTGGLRLCAHCRRLNSAKK